MDAVTYFKNWPKKIKIISDLHFGDIGVLKYERTQFQTSEEHNEFIIKMINNNVMSSDGLLILGDLGRDWRNWITKIKPEIYKILVLGNHDNMAMFEYEKYFNEVYKGPLFVNRFVVVSHEPIPVSEHFLNIHGHLHNSFLDDDHHINASAHMINYKPLSLDDAYAKTMEYERIRAPFLKEWYRDKYVFANRDRADVFVFKDNGHIIPGEIVKEMKTLFLEDDDENKKLFLKTPNSKHAFYESTDSIEGLLEKLNDEFIKWKEDCGE